MVEIRYNNYHKHDHRSNAGMADSISKEEDFIKRAVELGHNTFFTTNHGCSSDVYSSYALCKKYDLKMVYGVEAYYVDDIYADEKKRGNHLIVIALTKNAYIKMNQILKVANTDGFYYNPRIDRNLLLSLPCDEVVVTTACVNNRIFLGDSDWKEEFLIPLKEHFGDNFFLEVQCHNTSNQKEWNQQLLDISEEYGINIIHANDSHYIYPFQQEDRDVFLEGKGVRYVHEEKFMLDYPSSQEIFERYRTQGILSDEQVLKAIKSTYIFDRAVDLSFNNDSKMPTIDASLSVEERFLKLQNIILDEFKHRCANESIPKNRWKEYAEALKFELDIIKSTNIKEIRTADYFLINYEIIKKAINDYGGTLTRTGRGCFTEDSLVHTKKGLKGIKDVEIGDYVVDMHGEFKAVTNTMSYDIDEELIQIKHLYGTDKYFPTICTKDHKILIRRNEKVVWEKAENLKKTDYVCVPKMKNENQSNEFIDLNDYNVFGYEFDDEYIYEKPNNRGYKYIYSAADVSRETGVSKSCVLTWINQTKNIRPSNLKKIMDYIPFETREEYLVYIDTQRTRKINRFIANDYAFNVFVGLMYGDGTATKNRNSISLAINSETKKDRINRKYFYEIAKRLNCKIYENHSKTRKLIQLYINNSLIAEYVRREMFVSQKGKIKEFNEKFFNESTRNLMGIKYGLWLSDGSYDASRISLDNTSPSIINAYKLIGLIEGSGVNSLGFRKAHVDNRGYKSRDSFKLRRPKKINNKICEDSSYWFLPIKSIESVGVKNTTVYDFTVEGSHSYLINNMIVHNSAPGFLLNNFLGFTQIDRLKAPVPLYPTRFMSKGRILDSGQFPDIDYNTADPTPFIRASKDILGDDGCRYMIAYGTLKSSGAFRVSCKARGMEMNDYNEFGKEISRVEAIGDKERREQEYEELLANKHFGEILKYSERFVGLIDSVSPSPCSHLLLNDTITKEVGVVKVGDELCAAIDGYTADEFGFLKNDLLTVTVWKIIAEVYKKIGKPIPTIDELEQELDEDVWRLYEDGITRTLNQADSDFAQPLFMRYAPKSIAEMSAMVAALRPGFASLLDNFIHRLPYSTGTPEVDELLDSSYHYMLYQENIMAFLIWLDTMEDETYGIIKKISKKKFKEKELKILEETLRSNWIRHVGNDDNFAQVWQVVNDASRYSFNASHSLSVGLDSLYGANAKAKYSLDYFSVVLDIYQTNTKKTSQIVEELKYFKFNLKNIKFRFSNSHYNTDDTTGSIYKSVSSIKYLNESVADNLYNLRNNHYDNFLELLPVLKESGCNSRQIDILVKLGYFEEFGKSKYLLELIKIYNSFGNIKQIKKENIHKLGLNMDLVESVAGKETAKLYKEIDNIKLINILIECVENEDIPLMERLECEMENIGSIQYVNDDIKQGLYYVKEFKTYQDKAKPYLLLYELATGETVKTKIRDRKIFVRSPFQKGSVIDVDISTGFYNDYKSKKVNDEWVKTEEVEPILKEYKTYE